MTLTSPSAPGNPGGPATPTPADDFENLPPYPHGWTAEAWAALCDSAASRAANRIYARSVALLDNIKDFLHDHGQDIDADVIRAAGLPVPAKDVDHLECVRHHFAGIVWPLEQMIDPVKDVLPDDVTESPTVVPGTAEPATAEPAADTVTYPVYYVGNDVLIGSRPRLHVFEEDPSESGREEEDFFTAAQKPETEHVGDVTVPADATALEIEDAAMRAFGRHVGNLGRPAAAEFCSPDPWGALVGQVATVLVTWPRFAPAGHSGEATPDVVAARLGRSVLEVRDAMRKLATDRRAAA